MAFPGGSDGKESICNAGDPGSTPGLGISPEEGNDYPFQNSCLEKSMDRGTWQATYSPWGCQESDMTKWLTLLLVFFTSRPKLLLPWKAACEVHSPAWKKGEKQR